MFVRALHGGVLIAAMVMAVLAVGCGSGGGSDPLPTRRAIWDLRKPDAYRYTITINAFVAPTARGPVVVEVRNGKPTSVTYAETGEAVDRSLFARYDTITELFDILDDADRRSAAQVTAEYNADYGYPVTSFIDYEPQLADDELGWQVSDFTPLP